MARGARTHTHTQEKHRAPALGIPTSQLSQLQSPRGQDDPPLRDMIDVTGYTVWAVQTIHPLTRTSTNSGIMRQISDHIVSFFVSRSTQKQ